MLIYILKSSACLAVLLLFYKLLLEKENMHVFKRFYLLFSLVLSFAIPSVIFIEYVEMAPVVMETATNAVQTQFLSEKTTPNDMDIVDIPLVLWSIYLIGTFLFAFRFLKNLVQIVRKIRLSPKLRANGIIKVLLGERTVPHTFFNYIFLNRQKFETKEIPKEVLLHEETHARQKHSLDVLIIELLQVILWFNPLIYIAKRAIKLNHEFLADHAVLGKNIDAYAYQNMLLAFAYSNSHQKNYQSKLANAINYSSIKKRFTVMKKRTSKKSILLRSFMALPILAMLLVGFSQTKTVVHEKATQEMVDTYNSLATKYNGIPVQHRAIPPHDLRTLEHIFSKMTHEQKDTAQPFPECPPQVGATKYQISEYNALAKKYYELPLGVSGFSEEEIKRINYIYGIMSAKQKADAEPFPFPDFAKPRPTSSQIKTDIEKNAQDGASRELMAEYNKLAKHYNNMPRNRMRIKGKEVERLEYIYGIMSEKQKADAEPFPDFPPMPEPPAPPPAPSQIEPGEEEVAPSATDSPVPKDLEKNMEVAMEGHETAMKKQEREMEKQEIAMKEQETHLKKQEIAMEAHRSEREKHNIEPPMPPPPPAPKSPLDHAVEMAKLGAVFYFKNKKITSDEAIEILKRNDDLSMDIKRTNNQTPVVKIDTHF